MAHLLFATCERSNIKLAGRFDRPQCTGAEIVEAVRAAFSAAGHRAALPPYRVRMKSIDASGPYADPETLYWVTQCRVRVLRDLSPPVKKAPATSVKARTSQEGPSAFLTLERLSPEAWDPERLAPLVTSYQTVKELSDFLLLLGAYGPQELRPAYAAGIARIIAHQDSFPVAVQVKQLYDGGYYYCRGDAYDPLGPYATDDEARSRGVSHSRLNKVLLADLGREFRVAAKFGAEQCADVVGLACRLHRLAVVDASFPRTYKCGALVHTFGAFERDPRPCRLHDEALRSSLPRRRGETRQFPMNRCSIY